MVPITLLDLIENNGYLKSLTDIYKLNGYDFYLVGGAVRDLALGKSPKDIDLATDATPQEMQAMFDSAIAVSALRCQRASCSLNAHSADAAWAATTPMRWAKCLGTLHGSNKDKDRSH